MNNLEMTPVVFTGDDRSYEEISRIAALVGVEVARSADGPGVLNLTSDNCPAGRIRANFHELFTPYFARGSVELRLEDSADILELIAAVGTTMRGRVVGFIGAHGGAGTTTIAAWVARQLSTTESCALIDAVPSSGGIDVVLSIPDSPGRRWRDLKPSGAFLAGQLNDSLPTWNNVRVLSADHRGAVPFNDIAARAIAALAQVNEWTVVDLPPAAAIPEAFEHAWVEWCDQLVLVTAADPVSLAAAQLRVQTLAKTVPVTVVVTRVGSHNEAAHVAEVLGVAEVLPVRYYRGMRGDVDHGVAPGDRRKAGIARDIRKVTKACQELAV